MRFLDSSSLWFLALLPALGLLAFWAEGRRKRRLAEFAGEGALGRIALVPSRARRLAASVLPVLAALFLVLALARPQSGTKKISAEREGAAIAIVLDTSLSMATEDVPPSRFLLARRAISVLLERLAGDRVALVTFSGQSYVLSPLTSDYRAIDLSLEAIGPGFVGQPGSRIAVGLRGGIDALASAGTESGKAVVLLSDGEALGEGEGELGEVIELAGAAGIRVYSLGIGKTQGEPIPIRDERGEVSAYKRDDRGEVVLSRLEEETLRLAGEKTGGRYWPLSSSLKEISLVVEALEGLAREKFQEEHLIHYQEEFAWMVFPALLLLWIELCWPLVQRKKNGAFLPSGARAGALVAAALWLGLSGFDWSTYRGTQKGVGAYSREDYDKALEEFAGAAKAAPKDVPEAARLHYNLGNAYYKKGRLEDAAAEWKRARELAQDKSLAGAVDYNLGNASLSKAIESMKQSQPDAEALKEAISLYRKSLEANPKDVAAKHNFELSTRLLEMPPPPPQQQQGGEKDEEGEPQEQQAAAQAQKSEGEESDEKSKAAAAAEQEEKQDKEKSSPKSSEEQEKKDGEKSSAQASSDKEEGQEQQGEPQREGSISKEEAERILDGIAEKERRERQNRQRQLLETGGRNDW
ncbi:MAG: VWA domain-containing protein [Bdellovibrionota bacterium]